MTQPSIHNWGRWGEDDQLGALNLQSPESVLRALQLVRQGKIYNLAVPLESGGPQAPAFHKTWQTTYITTSADPDAVQFVDDVVIMETHSGTHLDALGHVWTDGVLWNGVSDDSAAHGRTLDWGGIDNVSAIFSRGVMLDIAKFKGVEHLGLGEVVTAEDMQACADAQGVEVQPGDVLLVRTGWRRVFDSDYELWQRGGARPRHLLCRVAAGEGCHGRRRRQRIGGSERAGGPLANEHAFAHCRASRPGHLLD